MNQSQKVRRYLTVYNSVIGRSWVEFFSSKSVMAHGFDNFTKIDPQRGILLVANHRTFFDQFAIAARLFKLYGAHHNIFFPVRANYFYDNPTGLIVNFLVTQCVMYPPIIRDRKRMAWNQVATDIMIDLVKQPENMIGFHPEGTRNQGPDPYDLLPAKPGCGEIIYRGNPNVVPVFLQGFPSSLVKIYRHNRNGAAPLVHMVMGEPMDFTEQLQLEPSRKTFLQISKMVMQKIADLAAQEKNIRQQFSAKP